MPEVTTSTWWQRLWEPFWAIPVATSVGAVALGLLLPTLDDQTWIPMLFHGGPAGARSVLSTITTAMISVTGLVFSITMVVLQLASSQFTPRVLGSFLDSRITQVTLGVFTGTFLYALTVLRSVREPFEGNDGFVPQLATSTAYVGVVASVAFFLAFIHHITSSIQVSQVIRATASATLQTLDKMLPEQQDQTSVRGEPPRWEPSPTSQCRPVRLERSGGHIAGLDYRRLVDLASTHDVVITVSTQVGEYVPAGVVIAGVWGEGDSLARVADDVVGLIDVESGRELRQDVGFGIRQLVDIAERALSPGVNDPTTAVEVIDALHSILRPLVGRHVPSAHATDGDGLVRLVYRPQTVEQLLDLAVREIAYWGRSSIQVPNRLRCLLDDLEDVALPEYRSTIRDLRALVDRWEERP